MKRTIYHIILGILVAYKTIMCNLLCYFYLHTYKNLYYSYRLWSVIKAFPIIKSLTRWAGDRSWRKQTMSFWNRRTFKTIADLIQPPRRKRCTYEPYAFLFNNYLIIFKRTDQPFSVHAFMPFNWIILIAAIRSTRLWDDFFYMYIYIYV